MTSEVAFACVARESVDFADSSTVGFEVGARVPYKTEFVPGIGVSMSSARYNVNMNHLQISRHQCRPQYSFALDLCDTQFSRVNMLAL